MLSMTVAPENQVKESRFSPGNPISRKIASSDYFKLNMTFRSIFFNLGLVEHMTCFD